MTDTPTFELERLRDSQALLEAGLTLLPAAFRERALGAVTLKHGGSDPALAERAARVRIEALRCGDATTYAQALEALAIASSLAAAIDPPIPSAHDPNSQLQVSEYVRSWRSDAAVAEAVLEPLIDFTVSDSSLTPGRVLLYLLTLASKLGEPDERSGTVW